VRPQTFPTTNQLSGPRRVDRRLREPTALAHELAQLDEVLYRSVVWRERVRLVASVVKFFVDDQHTSEQQFVRDFLDRVVPAHCRDGILDHTYRSDVAGLWVRQPKLFAQFANPVNLEVSYITHGSSSYRH